MKYDIFLKIFHMTKPHFFDENPAFGWFFFTKIFALASLGLNTFLGGKKGPENFIAPGPELALAGPE